MYHNNSLHGNLDFIGHIHYMGSNRLLWSVVCIFGSLPCLSAVSLQYICSVSAVSTSCALGRPAVHKGYHLKSMLGHVRKINTSSEVQYFKRSTMYFVLKYPLKCSEVCFEVQRSAYFSVLGLHCRRTWAIIPIQEKIQQKVEQFRNCLQLSIPESFITSLWAWQIENNHQ